MTNLYKNVRGHWTAEDRIDLGNEQQLTILTMKRSSGIVATTATVGTIEGSFVSHQPFSDYSFTLKSNDTGRCTEKSVAAQHAACLSQLDEIKESVKAFYTKKDLTTV